jgi:uncharacterized caspase-like protein
VLLFLLIVVALDGSGRTSPFLGPLAKAIGTPGQDLFSILIAVRNEVLAATGGKQVPWEHSALRAAFYFKPGAPAAPAGQPAATPPLAPDAQTWSVVQNTTSASSKSSYAASPIASTPGSPKPGLRS